MKFEDKLEEMFTAQKHLFNRVIHERDIHYNMVQWLMNTTVAMESEIDELRRELPWKWWKNSFQPDMNKVRGEIMDIWHFAIQLSIIAGMKPEDVFNQYMNKNKENHERQDGLHDSSYANTPFNVVYQGQIIGMYPNGTLQKGNMIQIGDMLYTVQGIDEDNHLYDVEIVEED